MRTVWKFEIGLSISIGMPAGAIVLGTHEQGDRAFIWAEVETDNHVESRQFAIVGTGHCFPDGNLKFIGSIYPQNAKYVYQVYEVLNK